ncbi:MAG: ABC transporter ATP-binding protein [Massiliimalia sp.]
MPLSVQDLSIHFGDTCVLNQVSFELPSWGMIFLLGPNGAGKSTLLKALCGLIPAGTGSVRLDGISLEQIPISQRARNISYLPQKVEAGDMTVTEYAVLGAAPRLKWTQIPDKSHYRRVKGILDQLEIGHLAERKLAQISGGECQLAALAQLLMQDTPVMLLDEPTANLDMKRQRDFLKVLYKLVREQKKCAVITVHDPNLALSYGDEILLLRDHSVMSLPYHCHLGEQLLEQLRPIYGQELALSSEGCLYWKGERRL